MNMINNESQLKDLAIKFRDSRDPHAFQRILLRMNCLLRSIIRRAVWNKPLEKLESEDFYNAAIIGLYRAVLKVKEEETENILVSKIIFYTNIEIAHWAKKPREKPFSSSSIEDNVEKWPPWVVGVWSGGCAKQFYDEPMHENLEREFVWDRFEKLVKEGVLETEDFNLLVMRFVEDLTYRDIAKIVGYSSKTVSRKIESIMCRIRWEWRRRRWGDDL